MKFIHFIVFLFLFDFCLFPQKIKSYRLPKTLKEISGLEFINDSMLVAHNDGGNSPILYLLNLKGKIIDSTTIINVKNTDWEDITKDNSGNLYIADIGNNQNKRKKLKILKVSISEILNKDSVEAEVYVFQYPDQSLYPPPNSELYYDAETIICLDNYLWIFTKCRSIPFDGKSHIYRTNISQLKQHEWEKIGEIIPGKKSWKLDSFTSGTSYKNYFYLITYNRILIVHSTQITKTVKFIKFNRYVQREAITISPSGLICVANEGHWLLGKQKITLYRYD